MIKKDTNICRESLGCFTFASVLNVCFESSCCLKDIKEFVSLSDGNDVALDKTEYHCKCYSGTPHNHLIVLEYLQT